MSSSKSMTDGRINFEKEKKGKRKILKKRLKKRKLKSKFRG